MSNIFIKKIIKIKISLVLKEFRIDNKTKEQNKILISMNNKRDIIVRDKNEWILRNKQRKALNKVKMKLLIKMILKLKMKMKTIMIKVKWIQKNMKRSQMMSLMRIMMIYYI